MNNYSRIDINSAIRDFERARNRAILKGLIARFTGASTELLSYEDVRKTLKAQATAKRQLKDVPLDAIVGSMGRYDDFTRDFLPRKDAVKSRWARVKVAANGIVGLPPIEVYQIGEAYFVIDGNHRVSVARESGATYIQAYVTEVHTRIPLTQDVNPQDLVIKGEYLEFLEHTKLDELHPEADLSLSVPGQYPLLEEHISVHRYFMGIERKREIPYQKAAAHWYETYYLPLIHAIREQGILHGFPGRTEADMYLWIAEHRAALEKELGWEIRTETAIKYIARHYPSNLIDWMVKMTKTLADRLTFRKLFPGPPPGAWRMETLAVHPGQRLFKDILVPIDGEASGWCALEQALPIAIREGARLHGLHVVSTESEKDGGSIVQEEFERRCLRAGLEGQLVVAIGEVAPLISERSRFTDLVVTNLSYPPGPQPINRLASGFHELIQRCPRPILATPEKISPLSKALLAYDGSPKSEEALFVATYLSKGWNIPLVVVCVKEKGISTRKMLARASDYLQSHSVQALYTYKDGDVAAAILKTSTELHCDLLIMGGYGYHPLLEVVIGSVVDQILRTSDLPVLICR